MAALCTETTNQIVLDGYLPGGEQSGDPAVRAYPFAKMADAAQWVGQTIVTTNLKALAGHCIQEIETWDDADEQITQKIVSAMQ